MRPTLWRPRTNATTLSAPLIIIELLPPIKALVRSAYQIIIPRHTVQLKPCCSNTTRILLGFRNSHKNMWQILTTIIMTQTHAHSACTIHAYVLSHATFFFVIVSSHVQIFSYMFWPKRPSHPIDMDIITSWLVIYCRPNRSSPFWRAVGIASTERDRTFSPGPSPGKGLVPALVKQRIKLA